MGDESETPINNFTLSLMFDAKIYINSSSMVLCRYGGNQEEGSIKIKFEKDTSTGKAYISTSKNNNKEIDIKEAIEDRKGLYKRIVT